MKNFIKGTKQRQITDAERVEMIEYNKAAVIIPEKVSIRVNFYHESHPYDEGYEVEVEKINGVYLLHSEMVKARKKIESDMRNSSSRLTGTWWCSFSEKQDEKFVETPELFKHRIKIDK